MILCSLYDNLVMAASQENNVFKNHEDNGVKFAGDGKIANKAETSAGSQQRNSKKDLNRCEASAVINIKIGAEASYQGVEQKRLQVQADEVRHFHSPFEDVMCGSYTTDNLTAPLQETVDGGRPNQLV